MGWVLLAHADATGQDLATVMRQPYARTLWAHLRRQEDAAMRRLEAKSDRLELASLTGIAFGAPKGLEDIRRTLRDEVVNLVDDPAPVEDAGTVWEKAGALLARVAALDAPVTDATGPASTDGQTSTADAQE